NARCLSLRSSLVRFHVAPASSERYTPPFDASTIAYTRLGSAGDTDTPIRPITPVGNPALRVISVQWSPPSVVLKSPLPGPPLDICHDVLYACHSAAYRTSGWFGSMDRSIAPLLSSRYSTFRHVLPPSTLLNTPRSAFGADGWPSAAT